MNGEPMTAVDAQFYWMSAKIPNDQFLLYAFAGVPADLDGAIDEVLGRARACPDLAIRVADTDRRRYPRWLPTVSPPGAVRHRLADDRWTDCLDAVVRLTNQQLDPRVAPWRLHLFGPVVDIPGAAAAGMVAVLQIAHALADGGRAAALAAWLFGRSAPVPPLSVPRPGLLPVRAVVAARTHRNRARDVDAGLLPPAAGNRPALTTNSRPAGAHTVRTLMRPRGQLARPSVTVGVLSAIGTALAEHLGARCDSLGAEVPMAKPGPRRARNHFGNVCVGLYPGLPAGRREERIAADIAGGRLRARHPAAVAADRAFAAAPAALLRWGVSQFDPDARPDRVAGNTVVSSVNRGPADLSFGGAPVVLTTGFPALSPVMGLTHGVHGIGDTVAVSVHATASAIGDVDEYLRRLDARL